MVKEVLELAQEFICRRYGDGTALAVLQVIKFCPKVEPFDVIDSMLKVQVVEAN